MMAAGMLMFRSLNLGEPASSTRTEFSFQVHHVLENEYIAGAEVVNKK